MPCLTSRRETRRRLLRFPPVSALAEVSGAAAGAFAEAVRARTRIQVVETEPGRWLLRADDHQQLSDELAAVPRPAGRLRVAVDPLRV